jgi:tRNA-uridine 2-sulfurtransferase
VNVLVAMSGGVDSSVAAARLVEDGHRVTGVTMKLWGGASDRGCCSVADVDDARRVAQQLDIDHLVFNFGEDFESHVVAPYVDAHRDGRTPNPCIECNRHLKFDRLLRRAEALGFDAVATGHHARVVRGADGRLRIGRGADREKDQSYVLYVVDPAALDRIRFPVGGMSKSEVRAHAARLGLRTAAKPDSQDVCFITATGGRRTFLGDRIGLHPGRLVDLDGRDVGVVDAVELVTVGQRRGLGAAGGGAPRYALAVDVEAATVTVGERADLEAEAVVVADLVWSGEPVPHPRLADQLVAQCSAHGELRPVRVVPGPGPGTVTVSWTGPDRRWARVAPGQSVVLYDGDEVVGGGIAV